MAVRVALLLSLAQEAGSVTPTDVEPAFSGTTAPPARRTIGGGLRGPAQRTTDRVLVGRIRRAIRADPFLAAAAPAVKVTSKRGIVRIFGWVRTDKERSSISFKAGQIAGVEAIDDRVSIRNSVEAAAW